MRRRLIQRLCRQFGIRLGRCASKEGFRWSYNGEVLDIRSRYDGLMGRRPDSDSLHDIAHWLCATPTRRKLPEYGLGTSVDSRSLYAPLAVTEDYARHEEQLASLLGILMERAADMPWWDTWDIHGWKFTPIEEVFLRRRQLKKLLHSRGLSVPEIVRSVRKLK